MAAAPAGRVAAAGLAARQDLAADEQVATRVCASCHDADRLTGTRRSRDQWMQVVENMVAVGARMTDAEYDAVMRYLVATAGRVNVNRDVAAELTAVLQLSKEDAGRIVDYRTQKGPFQDFEQLTKVPAIDVERLNQRRDAISF